MTLEHSQKDRSSAVKAFEIYKIIHIESSTFPVTPSYVRSVRRNAYCLDSSDKSHPKDIPTGDCITWEIESGLIVYCPVLLFEELCADPVKEIITQQREFKVLLIGTWAGSQHNKTTHHWEAKLLRRVEDGYEVVGHISFSRFTLRFELDQDTSLALGNVTSESLMPKLTKERVRLL